MFVTVIKNHQTMTNFGWREHFFWILMTACSLISKVWLCYQQKNEKSAMHITAIYLLIQTTTKSTKNQAHTKSCHLKQIHTKSIKCQLMIYWWIQKPQSIDRNTNHSNNTMCTAETSKTNQQNADVLPILNNFCREKT